MFLLFILFQLADKSGTVITETSNQSEEDPSRAKKS